MDSGADSDMCQSPGCRDYGVQWSIHRARLAALLLGGPSLPAPRALQGRDYSATVPPAQHALAMTTKQ